MANKLCFFLWLAAGAPRPLVSVHPVDHGQTFIYSVLKKACWTFQSLCVFWVPYKAKEIFKKKGTL